MAKKPPGVDQEIWDTPEKKIQAVHALKRRGYQPQPLRRVYIPKSDGKTMRPLGIPTMKDRSQQALHLLALDPVVETTADNNSYGFRQQRSCADAIEQCFNTLSRPNPQWILEGDIKSCFDRISHDWLLAHVPMDRAILQKWLKSGYMEKHVLHETTDGTPQGGIISPALSNCALGGESVTADAEGNVYIATGQIFVYDPVGHRIDTIEVPERPLQLLFGGKDGHALFILTHRSLYSIETRTKGQ